MKWLGYDGKIMGIMEYHGWLVVSTPTPLKNMSQLG
jgi:hypothetical protein